MEVCRLDICSLILERTISDQQKLLFTNLIMWKWSYYMEEQASNPFTKHVFRFTAKIWKKIAFLLQNQVNEIYAA